METTEALSRVVESPAIDSLAEPLSKYVRDAYAAAGAVGKELKNAAHGVWLGHPLHPVFTDLPLGAWTTALALDVTADGDRGRQRAATFAIGIGLAGAVGAAITGLTDWSETDGASRRAGLIHGLLNLTATALMATAFAVRSSNSRKRGRTLAWAGYAVAVGSAYLGGDLVYGRQIGVTHTAGEPPSDFTATIPISALADNTMTRVRVGEADVLLVRQHGRVCAMAHACTHLGGPLSQGALKDGSVVCPWHGSEFALEDGRVLNGPATHAEQYDVAREREGRIEIKIA